jgi:hypothetical protein
MMAIYLCLTCRRWWTLFIVTTKGWKRLHISLYLNLINKNGWNVISLLEQGLSQRRSQGFCERIMLLLLKCNLLNCFTESKLWMLHSVLLCLYAVIKTDWCFLFTEWWLWTLIGWNRPISLNSHRKTHMHEDAYWCSMFCLFNQYRGSL